MATANGSPLSLSLPCQGMLQEDPGESRGSPDTLTRRPGTGGPGTPGHGAAGTPGAPGVVAGPGSPWQYQLNARIRGRGVESPSSLGVRALSGTRTVVNAAARASYESALLAAVRRQIETFEEKVEKQISKLQVHGGKDASLARLEEKVSAAEGLQPRVERRLAELSGNFKGLSDAGLLLKNLI